MVVGRNVARVCAVMAAGIVQTSTAAEWYGTSLDSEGHAQWNNATNWNSDTGVPVGNINFTESVINGKSGSKTVYLDGAYTFSGDYHLYAGTTDAPLVFKASGENGFAATANKQMYIGSGSANPAYVVLDGGTYTFMNDINVGWNQSSATLKVKAGTIARAPYWVRVSQGSGGNGVGTVIMDGGEIIAGYRDGAEVKNGCFTLADNDNSKSRLLMSAGRIRAGGVNKGNVAIRIASGAGSEAEVEMSGGALVANSENAQIVIANGNNSKAIVNMTGGTMSSGSDFRIASNGTGATSVFTNANGVITCGLNFALGGANGCNGTYVQKGGTATIAGTAYIGRHGGTGVFELGGGDFIVNGDQMLLGSGSPLGTSTVALNGGTLSVKKLAAEGGTATVVFNGGTLKALASNLNAFVPRADNFTLSIGSRGATVDTASYIVGIESDIGSAVEAGETDGGLAVTGKGILVMHGAANYNGTTAVEKGVLDFRNGMSFTGPLEIGRQGAVTVEMTPMYSAALEQIAAKQEEYDAEGDEHQVVVPTVADLLLDKKVELFSASELSFEEATDDLSTSVFLTGPVVGYALSSEVVDGRTVVYATITNVDNIATTRKVTSYIATDNYVDQDGAWSNGQPADNSYDVGIFTADGIMHIWGNNKSPYQVNNRKFGDFVVRGCTAKVMYGNAQFPNIGVKRIAGNGTLMLARAGIVGNGTVDIVSEKTVDVVITCDGVYANNDSWIGENNDNATASTTVNGDVVTSNGFVAIWRNVTLNGNLVISPWSVNSYVGASAGDTLKINGDLVLLDGATFDFQSHNVTFGENARLVLMGGTAINTNSLSAWPATVIAGGVYTYGAVPGASEYTIEGGRLNVVPPTDGTSFELNGVTLADGVNAADVVKVTGTQYNWSVAYDSASGKVVATVGAMYDPDVPNYWVGGAQTMWTDAANWSRGVPTIDQTVEFTYDAVCFYDKKQDIFGEVGKLVLNGHNVTVAAKNYDKQYWGGLRIGGFDDNETGTLNIWKAGIWTKNSADLTFPATMKLTFAGTASDCWLRDDHGDIYVNCPVEMKESNFTLNLDYNVHLQGGASGPGWITARSKADRHGGCRLLGGDWTGFTGTYTGNGEDRTRFLADFTGSESATWTFNQYIRFDHADGVVKFGQVTFNNERHIEVIAGSTLVIEVGGLNGNPSIGNGTCFYTNNSGTEWADNWTQGSTTVTVKKVGTGTMTCGLVSNANVEVSEGVCALASGDANVNVTVREGATLYATTSVTVGNVVLDEGASVRLTTLENTPLITATSATISGATIALEDGIADTLLGQTDPNSYEMLKATGEFSGAPDTKVVAPCTEQGYGWYARASGKALVLKRRNPIKGFYVRIR